MFASALKSFTSNISANYTIAASPTSVAGAWRVYDGKKKTTGKAVSIFVFERKFLDPQAGVLGSRSGGASLKKLHDEVIERLKKEASSLARLRHPSILELAEPVEDTRNGGLMFATEPITASLAGLLQAKDDQEKSGGIGGRPSRFVTEDAEGHKQRREWEIDELEIQKGLLQVAKGLEFLHESAGLVHGNLTPDAMYINSKGDWKISGLGFSGPPDNTNSQSSTTPISLSEVLYHDPRLPKAVQLNLDYTSPDFVLDSNISLGADMFSLGIVILALYNSPHTSPLQTNSNASTYKKLFSSSSSTPTSSNNFLSSRPLPEELVSTVLPRLITRRPAQRMNAREFQQSRFFDNILVSTIRFLDSLPAKTVQEKSQFLRGLPRIISQFPKSVLEKKVLPALLEETKDRELLSLILQNTFKIIGVLPSGKRTLTEKVIPRLREVFLTTGGKGNSTERDTAKEAGLVVVLEHIALLAEDCSGKVFKDDVLPIVQLAMESSTHSLIDKSLGCLPIILDTLDFSTIKHDVFPVVAAVFSKTNSLSIKVRGLEAFVILCGGPPSGEQGDQGDGLDGSRRVPSSKRSNTAVLDKFTVQEKIVPLLKAIKTKEPAVMMAALAVFTQVGKIADSDFLAIEFKKFMGLIRTLAAKIEQEQTKKLLELSSNSTDGFDASRPEDFLGVATSQNGNIDIGQDDFERLVLGKRTGAGADMLGDTLRPQAQRSQSARAVIPVFDWSTPNNPSNTPSGTLFPRQASSVRATTPDQSLSGFAPLKPSPSNGLGNMVGWGEGTMTPPQPFNAASQWTSSTHTTNTMAGGLLNQAFGQPPQPTSSYPSFSIPPPPSTSSNSFHTTKPAQQSIINGFSIAPPPGPSQGRNMQTPNGGGSGGTGRTVTPTAAQIPATNSQKKGLDAYESLL
ncbi:MAG: kinase Scy1 [Lasallia pustulata]|uniref:Kinase Scy1 n=1 Tax=Lasallia pustulata TaxID=136370 RepID=A0A5M8PQ38_9LECA|nr:MAG: kinase Scy1 [Lasallia pustulata]